MIITQLFTRPLFESENDPITQFASNAHEGVAEGHDDEDPFELSSDYALHIANAGRKMMTQLANMSKKIQTDSTAAQNANRWNLGDFMHQHYETDDLNAINQVFEEYGVGGFFDQNLYELLSNWSSQGPEYVTAWKQYSGDVIKNSTRQPSAQSVHEQGVAEASDRMQRYGQLILKRKAEQNAAAQAAGPQPKKEEPPASSDYDSMSTRDFMKQLRDQRRPKKKGVAEATGDKPFDQMMTTIKRGTNKQKTADRKEQQKQTQQQARNAFGNMFGGGNPADKLKIREQGVAEGIVGDIYHGAKHGIKLMTSPSYRALNKAANASHDLSYSIKMAERDDMIRKYVKRFGELPGFYANDPAMIKKFLGKGSDNITSEGVAEGDTLMNKLHQTLLQEGRVKELADDLKTLSDAEFIKKYGKAKAAIRRDMKKLDEQVVAEMDSQGYDGSRDKKSRSTYGSRDHYSDSDPQHTAKPTTAAKTTKQATDILNKAFKDVDKKKGVAENTATGINRMFNNLGDPVYSNLQRVALLAMQGRQSEAAGRLQSVIKDASTDIQKKITDAVNNIKPVTINGKIADSSTLDKSKQHNDWIINTFIPWVQSLLGKQGVAEGSLGTALPWPNVVNKVSGAMKAMGWKGTRKADGTFMFSTRGQETDDQYYIVIIDNAGEGFFTYALGTIEEGDPRIGEQESLPNTEASVSELMNAIRDGFGLSEQGVAEGLPENAQDLHIGDPVIITGNGVEFEGATGEIIDFGRDHRFVVVDLYNHGRHSFHSSDVSFNEYAGSDDEEARMYDAGEFGDDPRDDMYEARMSAALRMANAVDKQRAKSDASLRRTPSSIPKKEEPKKVPADSGAKTVSEHRVNRQALMAKMLNSH